MGVLHKGLVSSLRGVKRVALKNPYLRATLYEVQNRDLFQNVYQHDKMIADRVRLDAYHEAIRRQVREGDTVADLGTGTGILAFFARKQNPKKIYAIDHGDVIRHAQKLAAANGIDRIEFVNAHSKNFDAPEKIDVILHEQIGEKLFDENMIANICDLRDRLLKPGGRILPAQFELFIEPFSLHDDCAIPFLWENTDVHGISYACLADELRDENGNIKNSGYCWRILPHHSGNFLCEPASVFDLDLMTVKENELPRELTFEKTAVRGGRMDGFCIYFRIVFDETPGFDTSPLSARTSWLPYLYRCEAFEVHKGDVFKVDWSIGDIADPMNWVLSVQRPR